MIMTTRNVSGSSEQTIINNVKKPIIEDGNAEAKQPESGGQQHVEAVQLIEPSTGKLFFEAKSELVFCKPHLMPLKSRAIERLEEMQRETATQLLQKRNQIAKQNRKHH